MGFKYDNNVADSRVRLRITSQVNYVTCLVTYCVMEVIKDVRLNFNLIF